MVSRVNPVGRLASIKLAGRAADRPQVVADDNRGLVAVEATRKLSHPIGQNHCQHWVSLIGTRRQPRWPVGYRELC